MTARSDDWRFDELHADWAQELLYQVLISKQPVRRKPPSPAHIVLAPRGERERTSHTGGLRNSFVFLEGWCPAKEKEMKKYCIYCNINNQVATSRTLSSAL